MKKLYEQNEDFRKYVEKYMKTYGYNLEQALSHKLVQEVGMMYDDIANNRIGE